MVLTFVIIIPTTGQREPEPSSPGFVSRETTTEYPKRTSTADPLPAVAATGVDGGALNAQSCGGSATSVTATASKSPEM